jgi:hypothetical protein
MKTRKERRMKTKKRAQSAIHRRKVKIQLQLKRQKILLEKERVTILKKKHLLQSLWSHQELKLQLRKRWRRRKKSLKPQLLLSSIRRPLKQQRNSQKSK